MLLYRCVTMPSRYAVKSTANSQATMSLTRCFDCAQKLSEDAGKIGMPKATDKAKMRLPALRLHDKD